MIFETMVFAPHPVFRERYTKEEHAEQGHAAVVRQIQAGVPFDDLDVLRH